MASISSPAAVSACVEQFRIFCVATVVSLWIAIAMTANGPQILCRYPAFDVYALTQDCHQDKAVAFLPTVFNDVVARLMLAVHEAVAHAAAFPYLPNHAVLLSGAFAYVHVIACACIELLCCDGRSFKVPLGLDARTLHKVSAPQVRDRGSIVGLSGLEGDSRGGEVHGGRG